MKEYMKPELEVISLVSEEPVTDDFSIGGYPGVEEAPEGW